MIGSKSWIIVIWRVVGCAFMLAVAQSGVSPMQAPIHSPAIPLPITEYYVSPTGSDSNRGSIVSPWATIAHAASVASAGTTVHVAPGTYMGPVVNRLSGTKSRRIHFVSDVRWAARVLGSRTAVIWSIRGDAITVEGFEVIGDRQSYYGIANYGSYGLIKGNHVHHISAPLCSGSGGAGIINLEYASHDSDIVNNLVHDVGDVSRGCRFVHGIYQANMGGHIVNNIAYRIAGFGIHTWHAARHVTIANNLVFRNGASGIIVGAGDSPGGISADYFLVTNNISMDNRGWGIVEKGSVGMHNQYSNNIVYRNGLGGIRTHYNRPISTITTDPRFVNYKPDGSGDYHLTQKSPAVDHGTLAGAFPYDCDNVPRPQGAAVDIGPYERSRALSSH